MRTIPSVKLAITNGASQMHNKQPESGSRGRRLVSLGMMIVALALAACSDEPQQRAADVHEVANEEPTVYQISRLDRGEHVKPEIWLASRAAGHDLPETAPEVEATRTLLEAAGKRFREYPRMIANRAVQLEDMLHSKGLGEPALQLITDLAEVPGDVRYVESFGSLSQQYYNLRLQGLDRQEALDLLKRGGHTSN